MRTLATALALALLALAGCQTTTIQRADEVARFQTELAQRNVAAQLDPAVPLTLDRAVELALARSLALRVQQLRLGLHDEDVRLAMAGALPKASVAYSPSYRSNANLMAMGGGPPVKTSDQTMQNFSVQTVIPILDWGATFYAYQQAKDRRVQDELLLARARQTLTRDVRVAYARLAMCQRQEELARYGLHAARELLRQAQSLVRQGLLAPTALTEVEAGLAQAALPWTLYRRQAETARLALGQLLTLPPGAAFSVVTTLVPPPPLPSAATVLAWEDHALRERPELAVQDRERQIAAHAVRERFAAFLPRLDGQVGFNWSSLSLAVNPAYFQFGLLVTDSLLDGGRDWWKYRRAQKVTDVEAERTLLLSLGILYEVDFGVLRLYTAHDTVVARAAVVAAQTAALREIVSRYREGLETGSEAVRALATMCQARLDLDQAQTDYLLVSYDLAAATLADVSAPAPAPPPSAAAALPALTPLPGLESLDKLMQLLPPVDLQAIPELRGLLPPGGTP